MIWMWLLACTAEPDAARDAATDTWTGTLPPVTGTLQDGLPAALDRLDGVRAVDVRENPDGTVRWLVEDAGRVMLVYGEDDPWTAGAASVEGAQGEVHRYVLAGQSHWATIATMPEAEQDEALAILDGWLAP